VRLRQDVDGNPFGESPISLPSALRRPPTDKVFCYFFVILYIAFSTSEEK
jgi:hypothetical protein